MRILTFLLIESLLAPVSLSSFALLNLWSITASKREQTSTTALAPLFFRWLLHLQGIRPDVYTHALINNLSVINGSLCWISLAPTLFAANLTGFTPDFMSVPERGYEDVDTMINARSLFFDRAITKYLPAVEQVVILGAGFDTRLLRFCTGQNLSLFEVDKPSIQQEKISALRKSDVDMSEISFVAVDFSKDNWTDRLQQAGLGLGKRTFFLWEGVTYYLTETEVKETLLRIDAISGEGSAIAFDVFSPEFTTATQEWRWLQPLIEGLALFGEPFRFGVRLEESAIAQLAQDTHFSLKTLQRMGDKRTAAFSGLVIVDK